ncbi:MAG: ATP-binding protein [Bacteroidota bacterium]
MNFRLGPRSQTEHPDWLPISTKAILFATAALCLLNFIQGLPLIFLAAPLLFAVFVILPLPRFTGGLVTAIAIVILLFLERNAMFSSIIIIPLAIGIGALSALLRATLLHIEWKFAALTLWQAIDESKASSGQIIISEVLSAMRRLTKSDITIALRELDSLTAEIFISDPPNAFPLKILPPDIYSRAIQENEIQFINNYETWPDSNRYLKEIGAGSVALVPLRYSGKPRGAVIMVWHKKNAITTPLKNFLELVFERLYASLTITDASFRLDKLQAQYDAILQTMPQGVAFVDESGAQNWVNHAAAKLLNIKEGTVEPQDFAAAMANLRTNADNLAEITQKSMQLFTTKNAEIHDWEWDLSFKKDMILRVSTTPTGSHNNSTGRLWMFEEVTERKRAENFLKISNENLQKSFKKLEELNQQLVVLNDEKNEFLGIAAHDLKNPLSAIMGLSQIIQLDSETMEPAELKEYTGMIVDSSQRMFELIKKLLDVNAIEEGKMVLKSELVELSMITEIAKEYNNRAAEKKHISILYDPPKFSTAVMGDENAITQVLDNLISNAVKYSPIASKVFIWLESTDESIRLTVKDEGPGLSTKDKEKLFKKFARLSAQPTGGESSTGLGLSIVKKLVEQMNGKVWCESELNNGASFIVELPRSF